MKNPKIFTGPMSKNLVDVVIELNKDFPIGLIPSRRQVEYDGGYVNDWTTLEFTNYIKSNNSQILICRDHSGPNQGKFLDDGFESLKNDCNTMDIIHIDPFKICSNMNDAAIKTIEYIMYCFNINPNVYYEIGTEEAICKYTPDELRIFIGKVFKSLSTRQSSMIKYAVVQSGTGLDLPNGINTGDFDCNRLTEFIKVTKEFGLLSKEHNGDFLTKNNGIYDRFNLGLDSINIAPEFGYLETSVYLDTIISENRGDLIDHILKITQLSDRWQKWIGNKNVNDIKKILTAGHYLYSLPEFKLFKKNFIDIDTHIQEKLKQRLYEIHRQCEGFSI
jgi:hypothetical protein